MEWILRSPQIHSTFGNLGFLHGDGYHINENCNVALETILQNILSEDIYLRTYRRCISFGQNIQKDLIPLLINAKEDKTIELLIRILVNLTIPVECLLSLDVIGKTDIGRHTVFEINNMLTCTKAAFTDNRATKVIIDFLKKNVDLEQKVKLTPIQCTNISNSLLLLRNILHIPEDNTNQNPNHNNGSAHSVQNQILWNIFSQSIDKVLIKLMSISDATKWGVTMVQLIALLYKDQHVVTLHKLLNMWLEASLSESSEDNESNTSPPDRGSEDSSPMLTSDPTSDSSDAGGSGKSNDEPNSNNGWDASSVNNISENGKQSFQEPVTEKDAHDVSMKSDSMLDSTTNTTHMDNAKSQTQNCGSSIQSETGSNHTNISDKKMLISENSDCGYGTQLENQESISTSSNEDEPSKKPVHQKPHNPKQRINNKARNCTILQEKKRKKIVKRGKANILNVQGLSHKTPTDDDISNILKEFTVDFLLRGYNSLVQTLHTQILSNVHLEIDTSHFFWLVTYFLKFATQIELDLEHVCSVLSFDIVTYLTAEGVNLCEQFELAIKLDGNNLKPSIRRLHLVVTAIREFVQAIEVYKKFSHINSDDQEALVKLQIKMCETEELRSLLVLLLRHYNPKYHTKQYLQDLIVTNHILLMFHDNVMKLPEYKGRSNMLDHIKQFSAPEIMYQYGLLLEDFADNGEFVNDCIFTLMHHVGGEMGSLISLFQPKILKTFTSIWKSEFEICDDWSDLIEFVINTFIKKPDTLQTPSSFRLDTENFDDDKSLPKQINDNVITEACNEEDNNRKSTDSNETEDRWTEEELSTLSWNYMQCNTHPDIVGEIVKLFKEDGIIKIRASIIRELFKQNLIIKEEFETMSNSEKDKNAKTSLVNKEAREDEIGKLCDQLAQDGKLKFLGWVQEVLLETCFAKIVLEKKTKEENSASSKKSVRIMDFELFHKKPLELPVISPVSYHALNYLQSVPLVPWNCEQASICKDLKFLQLLHKLGFHMPVDTGKVFIRIPHFWTADYMYEMAGKISQIDTLKLKFSINDISDSSLANSTQLNNLVTSSELARDITVIPAASETFYQVHKQSHHATMVNFTPMPSTSLNTESTDNIKQNWLELVQKSQETKLIKNLTSSSGLMRGAAPAQSDAALRLLCAAPSAPLASSASPAAAALLIPALITVNQEASVFNANRHDTEYYNNSACETASVASDLTRMYVSDEDEKPEEMILGLPLPDEDEKPEKMILDLSLPSEDAKPEKMILGQPLLPSELEKPEKMILGQPLPSKDEKPEKMILGQPLPSEDEKPEKMILGQPLPDEDGADSDSATAEKRPRISHLKLE